MRAGPQRRHAGQFFGLIRSIRALTVGAVVAGALVAPLPAHAGSAGVGGRPSNHQGGQHGTAGSSSVTLTIDAISPPVSLDGASAQVTGRLTNIGGTALVKPEVRMIGAAHMPTTTQQVTDWSRGNGATNGPVLARTTLKVTVAPGASAGFTLTVPDPGRGLDRQWGVRPVSVETTGGAVHTFLGFQNVKEYEPVQLAVGLPLVLPNTPTLWGQGSTREAAWTDAMNADGPISTIMTASSNTAATWLIDPILLQPARAPDPQTLQSTADPSRTDDPLTYAATSPEAKVRNALSTRIRDIAERHDPIILPAGDPDLAVAGSTTGVEAAMVDARQVAASTAPQVGGRADIAWTAQGRWDDATADGFATVYAGDATVAVVSGGQFPQTRPAANARRSTDGGPDVIATDPMLDALLSGTTTSGGGALLAQELVARTAVFVDELPGTSRTLATIAPRNFAPDQTALATVLGVVKGIPWVSSTPLGALTTSPPTPTSAAATPAAANPVTSGVAMRWDADGDLIAASAQVRLDGRTWRVSWNQARRMLLGAGWRSDTAGFASLLARLDEAAHSVDRAVHPESRTVNFLAESGRIQVIVVNGLDVGVTGLRVKFAPESPILRVTQGQSVPVDIAAGSRTTVTLQADALAAGTVPVSATLVAPDGTVLGRSTRLVLQVTPTGDWIYWALGAAAVLLVLAGVWRTRRRRDHLTADGSAMVDPHV
ncbi:MAG: DUF6049 family protein [Nostocoides sp.]